MKKIFSLVILMVAFNAQSLMAQVSAGGTPLSWTNTSIPELVNNEVLSGVDVAGLKAEDEIESEFKDIPLRFAYGHDVNYSSSNSGSWHVLSNGDRVWRLMVKSKNALSMSVTFSSFTLPEGASLFIYSSDKNYSIGAFTAANNKASGYLGTTPVPGDEIVIEYFEPNNASFQAELVIETIAHAYRDIFKLAEDQVQEKGFGDSGDCNNNVVCPEAEDWDQQIKSVALITLSNGTRVCSGSLLNNVAEDETPYFLTANHCLGSNSSTWVFIFNYFSDICDEGGSGNDGSLLESVAGSTLLENTNSGGGSASTDPNETDMALLLLDEDIPESYDVFYNGWDWSGDIPSNTACIHHPSGDVKKITWDDDESKITGYFDETTLGDLGGTTHWRVDEWDDGTTEGGSSGSPLFNDSKQVIGQLHGGVASCSNNINDYYGRLALSFQYISEWLDPDSTGVTSINGFPDPIILAVDPGIRAIQDIEENYCNENTISPTIVLKNYGSTEITAVDIDYYLDGNLEGTYNWTGSLQNGETDDIAIGDITITETGNHIFSAEFDYDGDENLNNNARSFSFFTTIGGIALDLSIQTDDWGSETSWAIFSLDGDEIASGSGYGPNFNPTLFEEQICVPDTCIEFVIYDSADDGICCDYGDGVYSVSYNGVELVSGGEFGSEESTEICPNLIDAVDEINPLDIISVYPNPAKDQLIINLNDFQSENLELRLINIIGQGVLVENLNKERSSITLQVGTLPRGMYLLEISNDNVKRSIKVVLD